MKDRDIVNEIVKIVPSAKFTFDGDDCVSAVFTNPASTFYGVLRLYPSSEKMRVLRYVSDLENLQYLDLRKNKLLKVDLGLCNLRHLDLGSNYLGVVPSWMRGNKLQFLNLGVNELAVLPDWFGEFSGLRILKLHKNRISDFSVLSGMMDLRELNLYFNKVGDIPGFIFYFGEMRFFSWGMSSLGILPEEIGMWKRLEYLSLVGNRLRFLPDSLCGCSEMVGMRLCKNMLEYLPERIGDLKKLREISLYKNRLTCLPDSFDFLKLKKCNLAGNLLGGDVVVKSDWFAISESDLDWSWIKSY